MLAEDPIMFQQHPGFRHLRLLINGRIHSPQVGPQCATCTGELQLITIEMRLRELSLDDGCIVCHHLSRTLHLCAPIGLGSQPLGSLDRGGLGARTVFRTWLQLETPT